MFLLEKFMWALGLTEIIEHAYVRNFLSGAESLKYPEHGIVMAAPASIYRHGADTPFTTTTPDLLWHLVRVQTHGVAQSTHFNHLAVLVHRHLDVLTDPPPALPLSLPTLDSDLLGAWDSIRPFVERPHATAGCCVARFLELYATLVFWSNVMTESIPEGLALLFAMSQQQHVGDTSVPTSPELVFGYETFLMEHVRWESARNVEMMRAMRFYAEAMNE